MECIFIQTMVQCASKSSFHTHSLTSGRELISNVLEQYGVQCFAEGHLSLTCGQEELGIEQQTLQSANDQQFEMLICNFTIEQKQHSFKVCEESKQ